MFLCAFKMEKNEMKKMKNEKVVSLKGSIVFRRSKQTTVCVIGKGP